MKTTHACAALALVLGVASLGGKAKEPDHLIFRRTYEAALLEARIRNVPVLVSRHKDF
jgi:hypothetical protein